ncbi:MAG: hypothetical protein ACU0AU_13735 [Cognatishimia activa]
MHFQGQELISRGTKATNRSLLFTSFAVLLLPFSKPTEKGVVQLLSLEFPIGLVEFGAVALLVFLVISHVISWRGDMLSYQRWNLPGKTPSKYLDTINELRSQTEQSFERFDYILERFERVVKNHSDKADRILTTDFSKTLDEAKVTREFLEDMNAGIARLGLFARFVLFGWFLAVPLLIAAFAILVSLDVVQITAWLDLTPPVEAQESVTE